jgi:hypothetical protein
MGKSQTLLIDIGVAAALGVALLVVFLVDRISAPDAGGNGSTLPHKITDPSQTAQIKPLRLGVTNVTGQFDDMAQLLREMGAEKDGPLPEIDPKTNSFKSIAGFRTTRLANEDLVRPNLENDFEVLFLACSPVEKRDIEIIRNAGPRLRQFVENGGTIYASDWRLPYVATAFPEFYDEKALLPGRSTPPTDPIRAKILDKGLKEVLGPEVEISFDLNEWRPAAFKRHMVTVYMTGSYEAMRPAGMKVTDAPLLVKFSPPKKPGATKAPGVIIFTSFHNAKQGKVGPKLLRYLVFHTVTARVEAEERAKIAEQGFEAKSSSLVSASAEDPKVTRKYQSQKKGKLMFNLAFNPQEGVKMRLRVKAPDGRFAEGERATSFTIEVPDAPVGEWEYTVTAVGLSNPNFPFTVTVAEAKE